MRHTIKTNHSTPLTLLGLLIMLLFALTKVIPTTSIAGYSVFVGIAFFFLVEAAAKTPDQESGLRFGTILADIRKPGVCLWMLLPVVSAVVTLIVGDCLFHGAFASHIMGRTEAFLSFHQIPLLIVQVILGGLGEEIAFRGFFVGKTMKLLPFWLCAVLSSLVFAAGHISVGAVGLVAYDVATIFIDSMIYAVVYYKSGNCLVSTISHILCNGTGIACCLYFFPVG